MAPVVGFAQLRTEPAIGVTIEAKVEPKRLLGLFSLAADIFEITFFVDEQVGDFVAVTYECEFLGQGGKPTGRSIPRGAVSRHAFKAGGDGRLIYKRNEELLGGGLTAVRCRTLELVR